MGKKTYEINDHLGNVRAVVSDIKNSDLDESNYPLKFTPDVKAINNYYAFGSLMPGRNSNSGDYRYGFTGLEGDAEVKGEGNSYTTAYRQYDPRIGRWLSRDALANKFAFYTLYQYAGNRPIVAVDLDGQEDLWIHYIEQEDGSYLKTIEHFEMSETYNRLTKKWLGLELPQTGAVTTVKRKDGTYAINSYTPTASVVAEKPAPKAKGFMENLHIAFVHSKGDATGPNAGVLEGQDGLIKTNKVVDNIGTGLSATPLAPIGTGLKVFSAAVNTGLDFSNPSMSTQEASINLGIRVATFGLGEGAKKFVPPSVTEQWKRLIDAGVNAVLDKGQEKAIEKNSEINK